MKDNEKKVVLKPPPVSISDDPRKKFSMPEVANHPVLRFVNRFWKHIRWAQKYHYKDCYLSLQAAYMSCSSTYLKEVVGKKFQDSIDALQSIKRATPPLTDAFATDKEYLTPQANSFVAKISEVFNMLFNSLKIESCILTEFWNVSDPQILGKIIPAELLQYVKMILHLIKCYDPIYFIVSTSICVKEEESMIIPVGDITQLTRKEWNAVITEQVNEMKSNIRFSKFFRMFLIT